MPEFLLGVDGGGSQTRAVIADRQGTILGRGSAGSSNAQAVGFAAATQALEAAISAAIAQVPDAALPVAAACFGLAGAGRFAERAMFHDWVTERRIAHAVRIVTDAELLLAAGTPNDWGIALIAGTGSICYGRAPDGRTARAGGWGWLLGDEGSGYDLGVRTLRLATQTADGRADAASILELVLNAWGLTTPEELIPYAYHAERPRTAVAALATPLLTLAESGDPHAMALVETSGIALAQHIEAVAATLALDHPPLAYGGGLLVASHQLREAITAHLHTPIGPITIVDDPVQGALVIARQLLPEPVAPSPSDDYGRINLRSTQAMQRGQSMDDQRDMELANADALEPASESESSESTQDPREAGLREMLSQLMEHAPAYAQLASSLAADTRIASSQRTPLSGLFLAGTRTPAARLLPGVFPLLVTAERLIRGFNTINTVLQQAQPEVADEHLAAVGLTREQVAADMQLATELTRRVTEIGATHASTAASHGARVAGRLVGKGLRAWRSYQSRPKNDA